MPERNLLRTIQDLIGVHRPANPEGGYISGQNDVFVPTYRDSDVYSQKGVEKELETIAQRIKAAQDGLSRMELRIRSPKEYKDYQAWQQNQSRVWAISEHLASLDNEYTAQVDTAEAGGAPITMGQFARYQVLHTGGNLLMRDIFREELRFATHMGLADSLRPYIDLLEFAFQSSRMRILIGGTSFEDVMSVDSRHDGTSSQFRFLVDSVIVRYRKSHEAVFRANHREPFRSFPNMARYGINAITAEVQVGMSAPPDVVDEDIRVNSGIAKEVAQYAKRFVQHLINIKTAIYRNILDPRSPEAVPLQAALLGYLKQGAFDKILALNIAGLDEYTHIRQMYRAARAREGEGTNSEFYSTLASAVKDYAKEASAVAYLPSEDDMDLIADLDEPIDPTTVPTFEQLGLNVSGIFQRSSQTAYTVDPEGINWPLSKARSINVYFDKNRPRQFDVTLVFESEDGEETVEVVYNIDAGRKTVDWAYMADPMQSENDRIASFRSLLLISTQAILKEIQGQAEEQYRARIAARQAPVAQAQSVRRERFDDPAYQLRKQIKAEAKGNQETAEPTKPVEEPLSLAALIHEEGVNKQIVLAEREVIDEKFIGVSSADREIIKRAIEEHNQRGVGNIRRKSSRPGAEPRYDMYVSCSAPKGARVFMRESTAGNGARKFEIINITYRGKTWKINKLWQR